MMKLNTKIDAYDVVFIVFKAIVLCGLAFIAPWLTIPGFILGELVIMVETKKEGNVPQDAIVQMPSIGKGVKKTKAPKEKTEKQEQSVKVVKTKGKAQ